MESYPAQWGVELLVNGEWISTVIWDDEKDAIQAHLASKPKAD